MKRFGFISLILLSFNIFISKNLRGQVPQFVCANHAGGNEWEYGKNLVTDAYGNIYVIGYFASSFLTFGSTVLSNAGGSNYTEDIFLVKYDSTGNVIWAKEAGG